MEQEKGVSLSELEDLLEQIKKDLNISIEPDCYLREMLIKSIHNHLYAPMEPILSELTMAQKIAFVSQLDKRKDLVRIDESTQH